MAGGFKKYSVDHEALFNDVRSNRYAKDRATEPAKSDAPAVTDEPRAEKHLPAAPEVSGPPKAAAVEKPAKAPPAAPAKTESPAKPAKKVSASDNVQIRVRVRLPMSGVSVKYDAMASQLGEEEAFRAIFRAAFEDYRMRLDDGKMPDGPKSYPASKETYRSNKVMTAQQFKVVDDALNPVGLVAPSTLGRMIAERALALFFQKENESA